MCRPKAGHATSVTKCVPAEMHTMSISVAITNQRTTQPRPCRSRLNLFRIKNVCCHQVRLKHRCHGRRWKGGLSGAVLLALTAPNTKLFFTNMSKASTPSPKVTPAPTAANFVPPEMHSDVTSLVNTILPKRTFFFNRLKTNHLYSLSLQLQWRQKCWKRRPILELCGDVQTVVIRQSSGLPCLSTASQNISSPLGTFASIVRNFAEQEMPSGPMLTDSTVWNTRYNPDFQPSLRWRCWRKWLLIEACFGDVLTVITL